MKTKKLFTLYFVAVLCILLLTLNANAALTNIGAVNYNGADYNLIWDNDNNGKSVVWLDFTNMEHNNLTQQIWAGTLEPSLIYNIDPKYQVTWTGQWRLPVAVDGFFGYNVTNSELGHLYYEELNSPNGAQRNSGMFSNLTAGWYWTGTNVALGAGNYVAFNMGSGQQMGQYKTGQLSGIAVRDANVVATPLPAAAWLLGTGLVGVISTRIRRRK